LNTDDTTLGQGQGAKYDAGKPRAGLMVEDFAGALETVDAVTTFGAKKYAPHSWATVPDARNRYYDAFIRHILKDAKDEHIDAESGLPHLAHIAWNALALLELQVREGKQTEQGNATLADRLSGAELERDRLGAELARVKAGLGLVLLNGGRHD
jgi:hypothetical protein